MSDWRIPVISVFMLNPFRKTAFPARTPDLLAHAEQALIAEALLAASAHLMGQPDPAAAARRFCESIVAATPNISLAWVWFGDPGADVIEPQVAAGPMLNSTHSTHQLRIEKTFFSPAGTGAGAGSGQRSRCFEVSSTSFHGPWRAAAASFGARSILLVPIANGGDERGWLALYATRPKYFETASVGLFETLGQLLHAALAFSRQQVDRPPEDAADPVTGLANRAHVKQQLEQAWRLPGEHNTRGLLVVLDLDQFRALNDEYGRLVGNAALRLVAQSLQGNVRKTDIVARWGGDQFLVWLPSVAATVAGATAEKLRAAIALLPVPSAQAGDSLMSVSVGATPVMNSDSFNSAHDRADRALHRAKTGSRGSVVVARPGA